MALILQIETATKKCSVALAENGKLLSSKSIAEEQFNHAEKLHLFIQEVLEKANKTPKDLSAVAISKGPGSYTGLRIGVSTAKGLCFALDIPLIAMNTLEILARQLTIDEGIIYPMIDARRMEVFTMAISPNYKVLKPTEAVVLEDDTLFKESEETIHLIGDGALKTQEVFTKKNIQYYPEIIYPSAEDMSVYCFEQYQKENFENLAYFEPFYLKDFQVTQKKSKK